MRIYQNTKEAYPEILRDIVKFGRELKSNTVQNWENVSDDFIMRELQCYSFSILDGSDKMDTAKDPEWVTQEFAERVNGANNPGEAYKLREEYWNQCRAEDGTFCYTYGQRMSVPITAVIELLKANSGTRQGVISIWRDVDHYRTNGKKRVPCSMYYNLQIREGKLDIIYHMRSSDFFEHFRNDVTLAMALRDYIGLQVGIEPGKFFMVVDSLHAYKKDWGTLGIY